MNERVFPDWPAPPMVRAFVTTRAGGVSSGSYASMNLGGMTDDDPDCVAENRSRFEALLPSDAGWLNQVHGNRVLRREVLSALDNSADAVWCATPGYACTVLTADCLPVLFCDQGGQVVAAAHAGWRGLASGVLEATLNAMPVPSEDILVWIGPGISVASYEVGEGFKAQFLDLQPWLKTGFETIDGSVHANLELIAKAILNRAGVREIYGGGFCTYTDSKRFFSHRRSAQGGRMASTIWLQGGLRK